MRALNRISRDHLYVQVTLKDLFRYLWLIEAFKINCEIYISAHDAYTCKAADLEKIGKALDRSGLLRRIHGPVYDPYKDGFSVFREAYQKIRPHLKALGARSVVMHVEYEPDRGLSVEDYLGKTVQAWRDVASLAGEDGARIMLENHHEASAEPVVKILEELRAANIKACFDVGHYNVWGEKDVVSLLDDYPKGSIEEVHLSDNMGDRDSHLALGKGAIDFPGFFEALDAKAMHPIFNIEAKDIWGVIGGMRYLERIGRL